MDSFDFVIVGGGTAGCILANRLTASGQHRVLLIEAGGSPRSMWIHIPAGFSKLLRDRRYNWQFRTTPEPNTNGRVIAVPRGRGLGGSTLINGMIYVRGQPGDYDAWARTGARGWSFEQLEPVFRRLERFASAPGPRGHDGPMRVTTVRERFPVASAFLDAAQQAGLPLNPDYNGERQEGFGYYQATQRDGRRWSAYDAYLAPALQRPNLRIEQNAQVLRLLLEQGRCTGVVYRQNGREVTERPRAEVLLAAGAIQSPQLLELSGIGQPERLQGLGIAPRHALPGVGENYIDHFATRMNWRLKNTLTLNELSRGRYLVAAVARYFTRHRGILTLGTGLVHGFVKSRPELPTPDAQYFFVHASYANAAERILDHWPGMTLGVSQMRPQSVGSIHAQSPDITQGPTIRPNFLDHPEDRECLVHSMRLARHIVVQPALADYLVAESAPGPAVQSDADWLAFARANGQTTYHPIGTCRMGEDHGAVVDSRLRVHGLDGLRVVDASVMPSMVSGNIQAAVMAVAERGADLILEDTAAR
ncbi:MAG: GMC family oxidoreductase N-terminal domain-containing protein [Burkholderiaceae bacterium]|nr:GMC family oxidoreductase N-terminal domain-containing protein [Burkholderiaceae bacterium]